VAKAALRRKKAFEHTYEQTGAQILTLEKEIYSIETANINKETLDAMKNAGAAMKGIHAGLTIDKVDNVMYVRLPSLSLSIAILILTTQQGRPPRKPPHRRRNQRSDNTRRRRPRRRRRRAGRGTRRVATGKVRRGDAEDGDRARGRLDREDACGCESRDQRQGEGRRGGRRGGRAAEIAG
jgi:hypothetical protein